jgi:hypothetical protein
MERNHLSCHGGWGWHWLRLPTWGPTPPSKSLNLLPAPKEGAPRLSYLAQMWNRRQEGGTGFTSCQWFLSVRKC